MSKALQPIVMSVPTGNLETYIQAVNRIPMLTLEDEVALANRFRDEGDLDAARQLVMAHLRFVVSVARGYLGYGLPLQDLIQEGSIGLMKAVKRFDPAVGVRLVSFAVHWIKAEIHEFVLRNWRIVKIATTKAQRKLFFNLRKAKKRLGWFTQDEVNNVASALNVSPSEVLSMESRLNAYDASYDAPVAEDDDGYSAPVYYLEDKTSDPATEFEALDWSNANKEKLYSALESLDERSRDILAARWLGEKKVTLQVLAERYSISIERVRQLEKNAMNKLKDTIGL